MIWTPHPPTPLVESWFQRHPTPLNRALHVVGVPPTIIGFFLIPVWLFMLSVPLFLFALSLFVGGYLLQFLGHALEGSPSGEMTFLKGWLGHAPGGWSCAGGRRVGSASRHRMPPRSSRSDRGLIPPAQLAGQLRLPIRERSG